MEQIIYKVCSKCGRELPLESFYISSQTYKHRRTDNISIYKCHQHYCKECSIKNVIDRRNNRPKHKEITKICHGCGKEFKTLNLLQKYCDRECWNKKQTNEVRKAISDEYRRTHIKQIRKRKRLYKHKRIHNDIDYRLKSLITNKVRQTINGNKKYNHSIELLGCSIKDVREHLESQFTKGMTWDNWGVKGWHIDHIIPISSFDFTKKEDQYRCFHYTNLRPLWWNENIKKSNKIIEMQLKVI